MSDVHVSTRTRVLPRPAIDPTEPIYPAWFLYVVAPVLAAAVGMIVTAIIMGLR